MQSVYWIIAIAVLQGVIGFLAKRAQAKQALAARNGVAGSGTSAPRASGVFESTLARDSELSQKSVAAQEQQFSGTTARSQSSDAVAGHGPATQNRLVNQQNPTISAQGSGAGRPTGAGVRSAPTTAVLNTPSAANANVANRSAMPAAPATRAANSRAQVNAAKSKQAPTKQPTSKPAAKKPITNSRFATTRAPERATSQRGVNNRALRPAISPDSEEYAAMQSRERLTASVNRVKAAENKVAQGIVGVEVTTTHALDRRMIPAVRTAHLAHFLRNHATAREALAMVEVLGAPRSMRPF